MCTTSNYWSTLTSLKTESTNIWISSVSSNWSIQVHLPDHSLKWAESRHVGTRQAGHIRVNEFIVWGNRVHRRSWKGNDTSSHQRQFQTEDSLGCETWHLKLKVRSATLTRYHSGKKTKNRKHSEKQSCLLVLLSKVKGNVNTQGSTTPWRYQILAKATHSQNNDSKIIFKTKPSKCVTSLGI